MSARFRIRTPQGQELSFGSEEMFADFVRSGELSAGDLVYDATTGEWSPALTHSLVLGLQAGDRDEGSAESGATGPDAAGGRAPSGPEEGAGARHASVSDTEDPSGLGFELAPEQTPEEASAAFVKELKAERESVFERREEMRGLKPDESGTGLLRDVDRNPPVPPAWPSPANRSGFATDPPVAGSPEAVSAPSWKSVKAPSRRRSSRGPVVSGAFLFWVLALGVVGAGVILGPDLVALAMNANGADTGDVETGVPILPDTEEALRERASARFLSRALRSLSGLPAVPREWLDGRYLSNASAYPAVREAWNAYLEAVRRLRVDEAELYSAAYLSALDDARVSGATRTLRLASALSRFERDRPVRAAHYDRVTELTTAALDLHDLLVEREEAITYQPAVGTRLSTDPILQAASADPETQQLLEAALDRVLDALSARELGPVEAAAVRNWVFEGLRDVVAPE